MNAIFITGTDTGVGKTLVTKLLAGYLSARGKRVVIQKWVETGAGTFSKNSCYSFNLAASPYLAARLEKKRIDEARIKRSVKELKSKFDFVIIEGTGGALVPFSKRRLLIDIVKDLDMPSIVVVKNRLGAINHSLLTIEALKARGIPILGIIFNNPARLNNIILEDNQKIVEELSGVVVLGSIPRSKRVGVLKNKFKAIGDKNVGKKLDK